MRIFLYSLLLFFLVSPALAQPLVPLAPPPARVAAARPAVPETDRFYYQCMAGLNGAERDGPGFKSDTGHIGLFQFSVQNAFDTGLCRRPVPQMRLQVWQFCDFEGDLAKKYNLHNEYEFRFDAQARPAQIEMMHKLTPFYDDYILDRRYDASFGKSLRGIALNPVMLRGMLHASGKAAIHEFMEDRVINDRAKSGFYDIAGCLRQCINSRNRIRPCHMQ